jgi:hypothetical protein
MTPNHRVWFAWENRQPPGPTRLHVGGEVETSSAHRIPKLTRAVPQGINPKILILNLTIEDSGKGGAEVVDFRPAYYEEPTKLEGFTDVQINYSGSAIQMIKVKPIF